MSNRHIRIAPHAGRRRALWASQSDKPPTGGEESDTQKETRCYRTRKRELEPVPDRGEQGHTSTGQQPVPAPDRSKLQTQNSCQCAGQDRVGREKSYQRHRRHRWPDQTTHSRNQRNKPEEQWKQSFPSCLGLESEGHEEQTRADLKHADRDRHRDNSDPGGDQRQAATDSESNSELRQVAVHNVISCWL